MQIENWTQQPRTEFLSEMIAEAIFDLIVNDKLHLVGQEKDIWGIVPYGYGVNDLDAAERDFWKTYEKILQCVADDQNWIRQEHDQYEASWEVRNVA